MWATTFLLINFFQSQTKKYHLHMINVGHGLAMVLHNPQKTTNILLDVGFGKRKHNNSQKIVNYLMKHKIYHLNAVFLSHRHTDHYNNFLEIQKHFFIENLWTNQDQEPYYQVQEIIFKNWAYEYYQMMIKENNQSLVLETQINGYRLFFPFDLEKKGEIKLLETQKLKPIDILQIAHHGSLSSSHLTFLKTTKPKYCLVSNKKMSLKSWKKMQKQKCQTWITGKHGNLLAKIGEKITIQGEK